ncbi:hypothetical protein D3C80_1438730 [compost metagenome]
MLSHEAFERTLLRLRHHATGSVVQEAVDHHAVVSEHGPDQASCRPEEAIKILLRVDAFHQRLRQVQSDLGVL